MDTKKRNIFVAAGAAAVVLVAGLVIWSPDFPPEGASGAIGAVQKHRETQIAPQDVVLTGDAVRKAEQTIYADFLTDAAKLENMSADLGIIAILIGNRQQVGSDVSASLNNVEVALQSHSADLQSRYLASMTETLNALDQLASDEQLMLGDTAVQLESFSAEVTNLSAKAKNNQLQSEEMLSLNAKLRNFVEVLGAKSKNQFNNFDMALEARNLGSMTAELGSMVESLQHTASLESDVSLASKKLSNFAAELGSRRQNTLGINDRIEYLGSLALQQKTALQAHQKLNSFSEALQMGNVAELQSSFADLSVALGSDAVMLESMALGNLSDRLESAIALDTALNNMEAMLGSSRNQLNNIDAASLSSFTESLANLTASLENRKSNLQSEVALNMQFELASIEAYLGSRQQIESRVQNSGSQLGINVAQLQNRNNLGSMVDLQSRSNLGSMVDLQSRSNLGSMVDLQSRSNLGSTVDLQSRNSLANAGGFEAYLGSLTAALEARNNSLGAKLQNRQQLGSEVMMLQNTAMQLESRNRQ